MGEPLDVELEQFGDTRVLRLGLPGWSSLDRERRLLLYYLTEASLHAWEIVWDQRHPQGLRLRRFLEAIDATYRGPRGGADFGHFELYLKQVWVSHGPYHPIGQQKFLPGFTLEALRGWVAQSDPAAFPTRPGEDPMGLLASLEGLIFDPTVDPVARSYARDRDRLLASTQNYYEAGIGLREVAAFESTRPSSDPPCAWGLNSRLERDELGGLVEVVWRVGGRYGEALEKAVGALEAAYQYAESEAQRAWLEALVRFYRTGDLQDFNTFNQLWLRDKASRVDLAHGFIETQADPAGLRGAYTAMVQLKDPKVAAQVAVIGSQAQLFENILPYQPEHKRRDMRPLELRIMDICAFAGEAAAVAPRGSSLPNAAWLRQAHGTKSVHFGNIMRQQRQAHVARGVVEAFAPDALSARRQRRWGAEAEQLLMILHEVIGHASGRQEPGVPPPAERLQAYASVIDEAHADLVALYLLADERLERLGLGITPELVLAGYEAYIQDALILQWVRVPVGRSVRQAQRQGRLLVAQWALAHAGEAGLALGEGPAGHHYRVTDHGVLREAFGVLLQQIQQIRSQGLVTEAAALVQQYTQPIDAARHHEIHRRWQALAVAPYAYFVNPILKPVLSDGGPGAEGQGGEIIDVTRHEVGSLTELMRHYAKYRHLPLSPLEP